MYLVAAILKNGRHFEFWNFSRWLMGFIKRAISKEYVCQFWCLFPEMKDSYDILLLSASLQHPAHGSSTSKPNWYRVSERSQFSPLQTGYSQWSDGHWSSHVGARP